MQFTAEDVLRSAGRQAPELHSTSADSDTVAAEFNEVLRELVLDVVDIDAERLATRHAVPAEAIAEDPIDLTALLVDDGQGDFDLTPGQREFAWIGYIDTGQPTGAKDIEVRIVTIHARNIGAHDYHGSTVGFLHNHLRTLEKLTGWGQVDELVVWGVTSPERVDAHTMGNVSFAYPSALYSALKWEFLSRIAGTIPITDNRVGIWDERAQRSYGRLVGDAKAHVAARIEAIPYTHEW